jgi:hypothetical protein
MIASGLREDMEIASSRDPGFSCGEKKETR